MNKNIKISLMIGFSVVGIIIAIAFGTQKEILPIGSALPQLKYVSQKESGYISINDKPLMIMYFKPDCPYCEYELEIMNKRINELKTADIYLITTDKSFLSDSLYYDYKNLINKGHVRLGFVAEEEYKDKLGIRATPTFYFFNQQGKLIDKIIGETKFDRLTESIKKAGGAQHQ